MLDRQAHLPAYRHYKPKNLGVVRLNGRDVYLGPYDSPESWQKYHRLIAEFLSGETLPDSTPAAPASIPIKELALRFFEWAEGYYAKDGKPTSEVECFRAVLRRLLKLYGDLPVSDFSPSKLKVVRDEFVRDGLARGTVNKNIARIRRVFRWGVEAEIVPVTVLQSLQAVAGLKKGRCQAKEPEPIAPVSIEVFNATLPHLAPTLQAMARLQLLSGCRPGEIVQLRPRDVDRSRAVWCFIPRSHKTAHHGDERRIYLGPQAQAILAPFLDRAPEEYCFSPAETQTQRLAAKHAARKTPLKYGNRPGTNRRKKPQRAPGEAYDTNSYRRAIERACRKAKIEPWSPNQLRHTRATELRRQFGLDAAQVVLGHREAFVTQIYAERDFQKAEELMGIIG